MSGLLGCAQEDEPAKNDEPNMPADSVHFDVDWKPETVLFDAAAQTATRQPDKDDLANLRLAFRKGAPGTERLVAGAHLFLADFGLFDVTEVHDEGSLLFVTVTEGSLLTAANRGTLSWDIEAVRSEAKIDVQKPAAFSPQASGGLAPQSDVSFEAKHDGVTYRAGLERKTVNGRTGIGLSLYGGAETNGTTTKGKAEVQFDGSITFRSIGRCDFSNGKLLQFSFIARDAHVEGKAQMSAESSVVKSSKIVDYPARIVVPFSVGPLPLYLAFGGGVSLQALASSTDQVTADAGFTYDGDLGFTYDGGQLTVVNAATPKFDGTANGKARLDIGVDALLSAPRIELGVGTTSLSRYVKAGVYFDMRAELKATVAFANDSDCLDLRSAIGAYAGAEAKVFGLSLGKERQLFGKVNHVSKGTCPDAKD